MQRDYLLQGALSPLALFDPSDHLKRNRMRVQHLQVSFKNPESLSMDLTYQSRGYLRISSLALATARSNRSISPYFALVDKEPAPGQPP